MLRRRVVTTIIILALPVFLSCQKKATVSNLREAGYHGKVKSIREEYHFRAQGEQPGSARPTLNNLYFNTDGQLVKLERLNLWENDKPTLNYTAEYAWQDGKPLSFQAFNRKREPVESGTYTWKSDRHYIIETRAIDGMFSRVDRYLDDLGRVKETMSRFKLPARQDLYENHLVILYDDQGNISETVTVPEKGKRAETTRLHYAEKDQQGNGTLIYLVQKETGDTVGKTIRHFDYY